MFKRLINRSLPAIMAAALLMTMGVVVYAGQDERREEFDFKPGQTLDLSARSGGSIFVTGWDKHIVRVTWSDGSGDLDDYDMKFESDSDGGLEITAEWAKGRSRDSNSLDFEIMAPHECNVEIRSGGGRIRLEDLQGEFRGKTGGGQIVLHNLTGEVRLSTGGGEMRVTDSQLDGKISTGGGAVLVKNVVGDLRASSGGGNVQYVNVRDDDGDQRGPGGRLPAADISDETVLITSAGGAIRLDEAPAGASVNTGGGNIRIRNAARFVKATTGGGSIEIEIADGPVTARTGAGDIEVEVASDQWQEEGEIHLTSGTGDITLVIPPDFSMSLDLSIGYTRNSKRDYRIKSDVPFTEERTDEWDHRHGSPRKFIFGTGEVQGGRHPVVIETTNGTIRIKVRDR